LIFEPFFKPALIQGIDALIGDVPEASDFQPEAQSFAMEASMLTASKRTDNHHCCDCQR